MGQEQFNAIMPVICAELTAMIVAKQGITEEESIEQLYASELYAALEKEETKVWHYSTPMLYMLFEKEMQTGSVVFPDV